MPFAGPALAPIISGYMEVTGTNFRWIFWVLLIFAGVCGIGIVFLLPETYVPYILHTEAKRLRMETGDGQKGERIVQNCSAPHCTQALHHALPRAYASRRGKYRFDLRSFCALADRNLLSWLER